VGVRPDSKRHSGAADDPTLSVSKPPNQRSRRALLGGAASTAGAAVLAGCGTKALREKIRGSARVSAADIPTLNALLDVENYGIAAYAAGIPLLSPNGQLIGKQFLTHELAHAVELSDLVREAGGKPHKPAASYSLGNPRNAAQAFELLQRVERAQLDAYLKMIPSLSTGRIRAVAATIFANDAQHLAVLRQELGQPLPGAFAVD
jgi:hypothetical protein